ncbi:uncharacterized protein LOC132903168 [Amyelois transitella]|uniref:uncharacterized protein LOC132903168 n=1 Tax=Amyelois transitella TaxID=680683 RepID=UPI00298F3F63|nr:uncharacterized protein LOC132903168 [Amyelois transitella]
MKSCVLIAALFAATANGSTYITQITSSPGIYFDQSLDVKFIHDSWNVVTYIDLSHIQPHLDNVEYLFERISKYCVSSQSSSKIQSDCTNSLNSLESQHANNVKKFSSISYLVQVQQTKRSKRGLVDLGGSILKTFFGTLDASDAIIYTDAINQVQSSEKQLAHLMQDNIHVIKSTVSTFNSTMSKIKENESRLNHNLNIIEKAFETLTNSNDKLEMKSQLSLLLHSLEGIIMSLSFDIDDLNNAILFSKMNILHPTVLSPQRLYEELELYKNNIPKHSELPVSLTLQNVHELINVSDIICYLHDNKLIIVVKVPLVLPQTYNLFHSIPLPTPYNSQTPDTYVLIAPNKPYLAITVDRLFYSQFDDVKECKVIQNQCYVCALKNVYSSIANPVCETVLLTDVVQKLPKSCQTKLLHGSIDFFQKITNDRWIFVQSEPGKGHITCEKPYSNVDEILFGTGILHLPKTCQAFYKTLSFSATDTLTSNISISISSYNIVNDDCCVSNKINTSISKLPFVKLNEVNNLDSLLQASLHLNEFEKELNKVQQPTHLEKYSTHYISLIYVITTIILLYLLYKSRKYICSQSSGCCINIYNQCHNKKTKRSVKSIKDISPRPEYTSDSSDKESVRSLPIPTKRNILD